MKDAGSPGGGFLLGRVQLELVEVLGAEWPPLHASAFWKEPRSMPSESQPPETFPEVSGEPIIRETVCKTILNCGNPRRQALKSGCG